MTSEMRHSLAAFAGIGLIVLIWLAPDISASRAGPNGPVEAYRGRIESIAPPAQDADSDTPPVSIATVKVLDGPHANSEVKAYLAGPGGSQDTSTYAAGDDVVVTFTSQADGTDPYVEVSDHWRLPGLGLLVAIFAAAVVFVGGWRGVRALVALALTAVVILKILIPAIVAGVPPVPLAVVVASSVTIATILLTEGLSRASLAAILGTTGALALTAILAAAATAFLGFTYAVDSDLAFMSLPGGGGLDLRGVLLAAIMLGSVGVLDDVTVTQAVLVDELSAKGNLRGPSLALSAMRIGRSHIGATVNTLFLAYVSVGLPLLIVLFVSHQPSAAILNQELIATELVRTLVGSLGIIAAIPLTTFIAGALVTPDRGFGTRRAGLERSALVRVGLAAAGVVVLLGIATAMTVSGSPRCALTPDTFVPRAAATPLPSPAADANRIHRGDRASALLSAAVAPSMPSVIAGLQDAPPTLYDQGDAIPLVFGDQSAGTVVVQRHTPAVRHQRSARMSSRSSSGMPQRPR